ncbi:hypothetical protein LNQ81_12275 [Myroides sp. M-43]|uniref:FG-GAP repeat protein n=1 Tax=Myroides oncorhynchi TaxID=2893756 RepID=UPI001E3A3883|nr:FG-GAP repeat protein [Myroides oncorhynchi]MCC9043447.1 hypothetical protein [Myroides oncorhynchi]
MNKRLTTIFFFTAVLSVSVACKDKETEVPSTDTTTEEVTTAVQTEEPMATVDEAAIEGDEAEYNPTIYPTSFKFKHDLILTGTFHEGEVPTDVSSKSWVGLVKETDGAYSVHKMNPTIKIVHDEVVDEVGEMTGVKVSAKSVGEIVFMTNEGLISQGSDLAIAQLPTIIYPGQSKEFTYKGKVYTIYAEGEKGAPYTYENNEGEVIKTYEIKKYQLYLKVKGQDKVITLLDLKSLEEATPTIEFAGDLNGDGYLDLLINTTYNYNMSRPTLYLSDTKSGQLNVKAVAALESLGC